MKVSWPSVITSVSAAVFLAACGGGVSVAEKADLIPSSASEIVVAADKPSPIVEPADPEVRIGNAVGERVPDFEVAFLDGSSVSREELAAEGKPTFLFFMATW